MPRPTLLVVEPEPVEALSVRKLVLETAKFNVVTAHSDREALELFALFPNVDAAVLVSGQGISCHHLAEQLRKNSERLQIIALLPVESRRCPPADHMVSSHEPEDLVNLLRRLFGDPRVIDGAEVPGAA